LTTQYCYDGDQVIAEYENGTLKRKFIYGPGIDEPVIMIVKGTPDQYYFYHFDALGSVVALSDSAGSIVAEYEYDVFGSVTITGNGHGNPFMFTGRRLDDETQLYYYRARMYHPELGRFMQPDPLGYYDSMNLYEYCFNNPLNWLDPFGLAGENKDSKSKSTWSRIGEAIGRFFGKLFGIPDKVDKILTQPGIEQREDFNRAYKQVPSDMYLKDPRKAFRMERQGRSAAVGRSFARSLEAAADAGKDTAKDLAGGKIAKTIGEGAKAAKEIYDGVKDAKDAWDESGKECKGSDSTSSSDK
jgi:RHS repeat-associated protein